MQQNLFRFNILNYPELLIAVSAARSRPQPYSSSSCFLLRGFYLVKVASFEKKIVGKHGQFFLVLTVIKEVNLNLVYLI